MDRRLEGRELLRTTVWRITRQPRPYIQKNNGGNWYKAGNAKWWIGGDFKLEAKDKGGSTAYQMMRAQGGEVEIQGESTRWEGNNGIDWVCSGRNDWIKERGFEKKQQSDHTMLKYQVRTKGLG